MEDNTKKLEKLDKNGRQTMLLQINFHKNKITLNNDCFIPEQVTRNTCIVHSSLLNFCSQKSLGRHESLTVRTVYMKAGRERCASLLTCCNQTRLNFHSSMCLLTEIFCRFRRNDYLRRAKVSGYAEPKCLGEILWVHVVHCVSVRLFVLQYYCKQHFLWTILIIANCDEAWHEWSLVGSVSSFKIFKFRYIQNSDSYGNQMERLSNS